MPPKQGQQRIRKHKWPLNSQVKKPVHVPTLTFFIEEISLWTYSSFIHDSKMFGNIDFHIPQQIKRNKTLIRKQEGKEKERENRGGSQYSTAMALRVIQTFEF